MFPAYAQRKGTLAPGQTISVNNFTVQVERYLSQGMLHVIGSVDLLTHF